MDERNSAALDEAVRALVKIGLERITGYTDTAVIDTLGETASTPQMSVAQLAEHAALNDVQILDVRAATEWNAGHIPGATHIPLGELAERVGELSLDKPIAVHCQGGGRSAIAASILQANGFADAANVTGGFGAWEQAKNEH